MALIPIRSLFRSRCAALAWAVSICVGAVQVAGGAKAGGAADVNAADAPDDAAAQVNALLADD